MSERISEILEVRGQMAIARGTTSSHHPTDVLRCEAVALVAEKRGIAPETVADKFIRQLRPHVTGVDDFDRLAELWLRGDGSALKKVLLTHAISDEDRREIRELLSYDMAGQLLEAVHDLGKSLGKSDLPTLEPRLRHHGALNTVGKTIAHVLVKESDSSPRSQIFFVFTDGTHYEIYSQAGSMAGLSDVRYGDVDWVRSYMADGCRIVAER